MFSDWPARDRLRFLHARTRWHSARLCALIGAALFAILPPGARAQAAKPTPSQATIKSFRLVQEKSGPAVEILSTRPLVPAIQLIEDPPRLVIDLPNAILEGPGRKFKVEANQIKGLRGDQFQANPAVTRIVVDLTAPRAFKWDAAGNRLVVHLGQNPSEPTQTPFQPPTVSSLTSSTPVVASVRTSGPLALAQDSVAGSAITAGAETAVLALSRGGEVYVCPNTSVSVTPSQNGHNVLLGMNRGALETHFALDASSDSVMTPDFRILLPGPGEFHYAISVDSRGNTCMRSLPGNTASAIVSELIGDRTYQVKATDQLMFREGQMDQVETSARQKCGCPPPPQQATQQAVQQPPEVVPAPSLPVAGAAGDPAPASDVAGTQSSSSSLSSPTPGTAQGNTEAAPLHVQVTQPLVFRATGPPPAPVEDARALPPDSRPLDAPAVSPPTPPDLQAAQQTPPATEPAKQQPQRSFFKKVRGFFGSIFR